MDSNGRPNGTARYGTSSTALALLFLLAGARRSFKVYERDAAEFGLAAFRRISDRQLVIDATFTGVVRRQARLYSTYDRSQPRGKRGDTRCTVS